MHTQQAALAERDAEAAASEKDLMEARKEATDLRQELTASQGEATALRRKMLHLEELLEDAKSKVDTSADALRMELRSVMT